MNREFLPYEQALELKELGFDEPCFGWFTDGYLRKGAIVENKHVQGENELLAPIFSQAFRWFRKKYKLVGLIEVGTQEYSFLIFDEVTDSRKITSSMNGTYEEAELACLKKLIEIVKQNK